MKKVMIEKDDKTIYKISFNNLTEIYNYLKSNPKVNLILKDTMASQKEECYFSGEIYENALEYLKGGYKKEKLQQFLKINKELKNKGISVESVKALKRGLYGGVPQASLVAANVPDCMLRYVSPSETKEVNIYFQLGYNAGVSESQVVNRGLATLYLIQALEEEGYIVNFYAQDLSYSGDEIIDCIVKLQSNTESQINVSKCFYPLVGKEFERRIVFRIVESAPINNYGWESYGRAFDTEEIKDYINAKDTDIIIGPPDDMNINGYNLIDDITNFIRSIDMEDKVNIEAISKDEKTKKLFR